MNSERKSEQHRLGMLFEDKEDNSTKSNTNLQNHYGAFRDLKPLLINTQKAQNIMKKAGFSLSKNAENSKNDGILTNQGRQIEDAEDDQGEDSQDTSQIQQSPSETLLSDLDDLKCIMALQNYTTNILSYPFWHMVDNTAGDLLEMGSFEGCMRINQAQEAGNAGADIAKYVIMELEFSNGVSSFKAASCLPAQCSQATIDRLGEKVRPRIQGSLCLLMFSTGIFSDQQVLPESNPECKISFYSPDLVIQEKKDDKLSIFITVSILFLLYSLFLTAATCLDYWFVRRSKHLGFKRRRERRQRAQKEAWREFQEEKRVMVENQEFKLGIKTIDFMIQQDNTNSEVPGMSQDQLSGSCNKRLSPEIIVKQSLRETQYCDIQNKLMSLSDQNCKVTNYAQAELTQGNDEMVGLRMESRRGMLSGVKASGVKQPKNSLKIIVDGRDLLTNLKNQPESASSTMEFHSLKKTLGKIQGKKSNNNSTGKSKMPASKFKLGSQQRILESDSFISSENNRCIASRIQGKEPISLTKTMPNQDHFNFNPEHSSNDLIDLRGDKQQQVKIQNREYFKIKPSINQDDSENVSSSSSSSSEAPKLNPQHIEVFQSNNNTESININSINKNINSQFKISQTGFYSSGLQAMRSQKPLIHPINTLHQPTGNQIQKKTNDERPQDGVKKSCTIPQAPGTAERQEEMASFGGLSPIYLHRQRSSKQRGSSSKSIYHQRSYSAGNIRVDSDTQGARELSAWCGDSVSDVKRITRVKKLHIDQLDRLFEVEDRGNADYVQTQAANRFNKQSFRNSNRSLDKGFIDLYDSFERDQRAVKQTESPVSPEQDFNSLHRSMHLHKRQRDQPTNSFKMYVGNSNNNQQSIIDTPSLLFYYGPYITFLNCFSLLRTIEIVRQSRSAWRQNLEKTIWKLGEIKPKIKGKFQKVPESKVFMNQSDSESETEENRFFEYLNQGGHSDPERWMLVKGRGSRELDVFDGVRAMAYLMISMYLSGFMQKDLLLKNRWKEVEMMETKKEIWAVIASVWAYLDILYFYSAFFQSLKLTQYFQWCDYKDQLARKFNSRQGSDQVAELKSFQKRKKSCTGLGITSKQLKQILEIYFLRVLRMWPLLIFTMVFFSSSIYFLGSGPTWIELENLYQDCDNNWWTVLFFLNDIVPYYAKDLNGCMRFTAVYSIEFKLFLFLPIFILIYHKGYKKMVVSMCIFLILLCQILTVWLFQKYKFMPGYLGPMDPLAMDLFTLKPYMHIDAYFAGVLLAFVYNDFKMFKAQIKHEQELQESSYENTVESDVDCIQKIRQYLYQFLLYNISAPYILLITSAFYFQIFIKLHTHIDQTQFNEQGDFIMYATEKSILFNSYIIPISKLLLLASAAIFSLLIFLRKLPFLQHFLSSTLFTFIAETTFASSLLLPIISKTFLATMTHAVTSAPQFNFYNLFFSLILSLFLGYALRITIERPIIDAVTTLYFRAKSKISDLNEAFERKRQLMAAAAKDASESEAARGAGSLADGQRSRMRSGSKKVQAGRGKGVKGRRYSGLRGDVGNVSVLSNSQVKRKTAQQQNFEEDIAMSREREGEKLLRVPDSQGNAQVLDDNPNRKAISDYSQGAKGYDATTHTSKSTQRKYRKVKDGFNR